MRRGLFEVWFMLVLVHTRYLRVQKSCSLYAAAIARPSEDICLQGAQPARDTSYPCMHVSPRMYQCK